MSELSDLRVAVIATNGFEASELLQPLEALRAAGAQVKVISPESGTIQSASRFLRSTSVTVDADITQVHSEDFDALVLPGGAENAAALREDPRVLEFVREIHGSAKPIAAICHAAWILISADVVRGRTLTSYPDIRNDVRNAGGKWVDQEVAVSQNWVTSRKPADLPAFIRETIALFSRSTPDVIQVDLSA